MLFLPLFLPFSSSCEEEEREDEEELLLLPEDVVSSSSLLLLLSLLLPLRFLFWAAVCFVDRAVGAADVAEEGRRLRGGGGFAFAFSSFLAVDEVGPRLLTSPRWLAIPLLDFGVAERPLFIFFVYLFGVSRFLILSLTVHF